MDLKELAALPNGARFRRADLHIHSHGGSFDVSDTTMTPEAIVDTAIAERLEVIAITDHNSITGVARAVAHAKGKGLLVVPAVELTTTQGHLLVYMPTEQALGDFVGRLTPSAARDYYTNGLEQCVALAGQLGGFAIAAHIEVDSGFEAKMPGFTPMKAGFLNQEHLLALEIKSSSATDWYTVGDAEGERARLAKERRQRLGIDEDLPKVMSSDAHTLNALGRNAAGDRRVSRLKMDQLTFDALRIALMEGGVRCRLEEQIPQSLPRIVGMHLQGGFLDAQALHFSPNMTCIIGGRGTGKSTLLESLRAASGNEAKEDVIDSDEVGADTITLWYADETGTHHTLVRNRGDWVRNLGDPNGPSFVRIEGYGQGETAETIQHCGKDPAILVKFLDRFVDMGAELEKEKVLIRQLRDASKVIAELDEDVKSLGRYKELRTVTATKIATLKKEKATEVIELEESLAKEKLYCRELEECLRGVNSPMDDELAIAEYVNGIDEAVVRVGKQQLEAIRTACSQLQEDVRAGLSQFKSKREAFAAAIRGHITAWRAKEAAERADIEAKRKALEAAGVRLDIPFIRKVTADAATYEKKIRELEQKATTLRQARLDRKKLVAVRLSLRSEIFTKRTAMAVTMNANLGATGEDGFQVVLKFREACLSAACEQIIVDAMNYRTTRVSRAEALVRQVALPGLLAALDQRDRTAFAKVVDPAGTALFSDDDAAQLIEVLGTEAVRSKIEECAFEDLASITVQGSVVAGSGTRIVKREFANLSLGQQQSIVLSMLLFSESQDPLVIDQPEDNLDSLFIAKVLVANLRKIKERRQVIVVTHNPNIAVLADTELIVPLRASSEKATIAERGSIDTAVTQKHVCRILEGGEVAFKKRAKIYGSLATSKL
jgi:energy-coupling factor transporter ATP-binding protein EcfA2